MFQLFQRPTCPLLRDSSENGYEIIPLKYDEAGNFSDGLAKVRIGGKYGKYSPILDK